MNCDDTFPLGHTCTPGPINTYAQDMVRLMLTRRNIEDGVMELKMKKNLAEKAKEGEGGGSDNSTSASGNTAKSKSGKHTKAKSGKTTEASGKQSTKAKSGKRSKSSTAKSGTKRTTKS